MDQEILSLSKMIKYTEVWGCAVRKSVLWREIQEYDWAMSYDGSQGERPVSHQGLLESVL